MEPTPETRGGEYGELHAGLRQQRDENAHSAECFLEVARSFFPIKSMLDIGCGLGTWLYIFQQQGIEIAGVEGPWCEMEKLEVDPRLVTITDLEKPIELGKRFDVAVSLEVGEHLSGDAAPHLVRSLVTHADHVIYSAAIPFQKGTHHINEQFLRYWVKHFADNGYKVVDIFRPLFWEDESIHWWLRQNAVLFVKEEVLESNPMLKAESLIKRPLDIVAPQVYHDRVVEAKNTTAALQNMLLKSGKARLRDTPNGTMLELT